MCAPILVTVNVNMQYLKMYTYTIHIHCLHPIHVASNKCIIPTGSIPLTHLPFSKIKPFSCHIFVPVYCMHQAYTSIVLQNPYIIPILFTYYLSPLCIQHVISHCTANVNSALYCQCNIMY